MDRTKHRYKSQGEYEQVVRYSMHRGHRQSCIVMKMQSDGIRSIFQFGHYSLTQFVLVHLRLSSGQGFP